MGQWPLEYGIENLLTPELGPAIEGIPGSRVQSLEKEEGACPQRASS
jgi:hypothetical protein